MELDMTYVYQVYQDGSFSRAAEHLFLTQPALSIAIRRIEKTLGMPLFDRNKRPLELTEAGKAYIHAVEETKFIEEEMLQQISDIRDLNTGTLRIGGSHYLTAYILPSVLAGFNHEYPGIRIEITEESAADLAVMITERKLDLTFNCDENFVKDYRHYPAFKDTVLLAVPAEEPVNRSLGDMALNTKDILEKRHLAEDCPVLSLTEFRELEFILLSEGNNMYDRSQQFFSESGFTPKVKMTLSQLVTAWHLAQSGLASTFISDRLVNKDSTDMYFYKLNSKAARRQFYIVLPNKTYTSYATSAFIRYFQSFKEEKLL